MSESTTAVWPWVAGGAAAAFGTWYLLRDRGASGGTDGGTSATTDIAPPGPVAAAAVPTVIASATPRVIAPPVPSVIAPPVSSVIAPPMPSVIAPSVPSVIAPAVATEVPNAHPSVTWAWPLPSWSEYAPVISDGWGSNRDGGARTHKGADVMYRRRRLDDQLAVFPAAPPYSLWHFVPPGTPVLAAADGFLWSAGKTQRGYAVVIAHKKPWATYYTHLSGLLVPEVARGAGRIPIVQGQVLGFVGVDPTNPKIAHLHFEIWKGGAGGSAIDPAPILAGARVLSRPTRVPSLVTPPAERTLDQIFAAYGHGIPVPYLRALARAESGLRRDHPMGVINVVKVALDAYNARHPSVAVRAADLRDPVVSVTVAADHLRTIGAALAANHPTVVNLREDWNSPRFVELLTAAWNAGHSERAGVGRGATWLAARGLDVTITNLWRFAREAGLASTFQNRGKLAFATRVADEYMRTRAGGAL